MNNAFGTGWCELLLADDDYKALASDIEEADSGNNSKFVYNIIR